jgi:hypothetical protein
MLSATGGLRAAGPYEPPAGQSGSTAIHKDDPRIVGWASGWQDYLVGADCAASWQTPAKALGKAVGDSFDIVCLGNGGRITLTFSQPITNRAGWDFAVFENGFSDTFLELGYVEVSSNGTDFFRFVNSSLTASPVGAFGAIDPTNIDGLAGKYRQGYGTPFDLEQLAAISPDLDVANIGYVRIVDIVGDGTCLDTAGRIIYDPHKTVGSGGFDLDAVGVLHAVPEPAEVALLASCALAGVVVARRRVVRCLKKLREVFSSRWIGRSQPGTHTRQQPLASMLVAAACLLFGTSVVCGETVDFADLSPTTSYSGPGGGAYWNGPVPAGTGTEEPDPWGGTVRVGSFTSGGAMFVNRYNLTFGSWSGFAYSNTKDTTTAGYLNQFSAFTGDGYGGSGNYAVGFGYADYLDPMSAAQLAQLPHFQIPMGLSIQSVRITNTTYVALSMLVGDSFAKKFGGATGNDPDWLKVTAYGTDAAGKPLPVSAEFYLADFRSADNTKDYIVNQWTEWDLSALKDAKDVYFNLTSTDAGEWGMNTPGYFAVDHLTLSAVPEPTTWAMLIGGVIVTGVRICRRRLVGSSRHRTE